VRAFTPFDIVIAVLFVVFAAAWAWISYLTIRARWQEPSPRYEDSMPFSFRPGVTVLAWLGGACGLAAFACGVYLYQKLR
jgi:hypothetical protein